MSCESMSLLYVFLCSVLYHMMMIIQEIRALSYINNVVMVFFFIGDIIIRHMLVGVL